MKSLMPQFPQIQRITTDECVGVKTYVGNHQYGEVCHLTKQRSEETKQKLLDDMENDLLRQLADKTK